TNPVNGQVHLKVAYVTQEMNFADITSKIDGSLDSKTYVYDVSALTEKTINNKYIPLFQKDVVKQYAVLTKAQVFNSSTGKWEIPDAYYHNGSKWIQINYKLYAQMDNNVLFKMTTGFDIDRQENWTVANGKIFFIDTEGNIYTQRRIQNVAL